MFPKYTDRLYFSQVAERHFMMRNNSALTKNSIDLPRDKLLQTLRCVAVQMQWFNTSCIFEIRHLTCFNDSIISRCESGRSNYRSQESGVLYFQQQEKVTVHSVNNTNINAIEI